MKGRPTGDGVDARWGTPVPAPWAFARGSLLILLLTACALGCAPPPAPPGDSRRDDPKPHPVPQAKDVVRYTIERLTKQGLSPDAAQAIAQFNERYFRIVWEEDRQQWERTVALFGRLGSQSHIVQQRVVQVPDLVSLLAGSLEARKDGPQAILRSLPERAEERDAIRNLYGLFTEASDAVKLADALDHDRELVLRLTAHDPAMSLLPWLLQSLKDPDAQRVYSWWVREVIRQALDDSSQGDEKALARASTLLDVHALKVRELLERDALFRREFREKYWPRFAATLRNAQQKAEPSSGEDISESDIAWSVNVFAPCVWDYFHQLAGQGDFIFEVFDRWGLVAVDLALTPEYRDVQARVLEALRVGDEQVIDALRDEALRKEPLFSALLKRDLGGGTLAAALHQLGEAPAQAPGKLRYWQTLSDTALIEELGPPPEGPKTWVPGYQLYYHLLRKSYQGRLIHSSDLLWAAVDIAEGLLIVVKGPARIATLGRSVAARLARRGLSEAAEVAGKASARQLAPLVLEDAAGVARRELKAVTASRTLLQADVTEVMRYSFRRLQQLGFGRKTFTVFTGLEARVFMRSDRRVVFQVADLFDQGSILGRLLRETAVKAGFDMALRSPPGQMAVGEALRAASVSSEKAAEQLKAWRQHLSLWWIAVHTGALDRASKQKNTAGGEKGWTVPAPVR